MADSKDDLKKSALRYHQFPTPGKISIAPTKPMTTQRDLALAYSPGVAAPCEEIAADPLKALDYTSRGNTVAVISNGTAVLGLGSIGALASKPVMEGKAVLFKKFAGIDSVDIEVNETDIDKFVDTITPLEPSWGGINLEDIKAPECFEIEERLKERMNIPVFHDDQHGTAIIVAAGFSNWLRYTNRKIKDIKLVCSGAGAAAIACLNLLVHAGLPRENIIVCDREGVVYEGRNTGMDPYKEKYASKTKHRTLKEAIAGTDVFLGLSAPGVVDQKMIKSMNKGPLVMALANPVPEILPEEVYKARPKAIVCTGRSDYPNQVNNVLCFPYIFRGALDVGATTINEEMKLACVEAIAELARLEATPEVASVYENEDLTFGPNYLIPKPFDPRLIVNLPIAVAKAAMESGVATRPIEDFEAYKEKLKRFYIQTQIMISPVYARAQENPKRIVFAEGEDDRILRAMQVIVDDKIAKPILIGRRRVIETRIKRFGLRAKIDEDFQVVDPEDDPRYKEYWTLYHSLMERRGITPAVAKTVLRTNTTVIAALLMIKGEADGMICGTVGEYHKHLGHVCNLIGLKNGVETAAALVALVTPKGPLFICDTHVNPNPSIAQISEMVLLAAEQMRRFGIDPKVALLSHSNFGTRDDESAFKMRAVYHELRSRDPELMVEGEMHADAALSESIRNEIMPNSNLEGTANLLVMPDVQSANITYNTVKVMTDAVTIGPQLLGISRPAHILTQAVTPRGIVNMAALASVEAQIYEKENSQQEMTSVLSGIAFSK
jgi:malate dehydrogenase (oxaloacetate-decarboxylating)(NADP+)